jgi:hypothetical protein
MGPMITRSTAYPRLPSTRAHRRPTVRTKCARTSSEHDEGLRPAGRRRALQVGEVSHRRTGESTPRSPSGTFRRALHTPNSQNFFFLPESTRSRSRLHTVLLLEDADVPSFPGLPPSCRLNASAPSLPLWKCPLPALIGADSRLTTTADGRPRRMLRLHPRPA